MWGNYRRTEEDDEETLRVSTGQKGGMRTRKVPRALRAGHFYFLSGI